MKANFNDLMDRIFSLSKHGIKMGLDNMVLALKALELDLSSIRFIHIAGTNGKGSTAITLSTLIREHTSGQKTGLYTSPHLIKFNERIVVDDKEITDEEMVKIADIIFTKCLEIPLTFFEFTTLMALYHFINNNVTFAIMETGLGGNLDATNIIKPEISIITSIDYDHMEYLGETLKEIAIEKAGIFKKGSVAIIGRTSCNDVLRERANNVGVKQILELEKDFNYLKNKDGSFDLLLNNKVLYNWLNKKLLGEHQYANSSLAIIAFNLLGLNGSRKTITQALNDVVWPGRLEALQIRGKTAYIDVSHNIQGMQKTVEFIQSEHKEALVYTACGFMKDKDYSKMIEVLEKISKKIFLIPTTVPERELNKSDYENLLLKRQNSNLLICNDFNDAIDKMVKEEGILLFTGSIYNYEHLHKLLKEVG
jgi:dihydrofolate synthase / folylpolyglutamate synthase